jgi:hypothetical protein
MKWKLKKNNKYKERHIVVIVVTIKSNLNKKGLFQI